MLALVNKPSLAHPYLCIKFLIMSSALSLWPQHRCNHYCRAMGPGETFPHFVTRSTSPLSKSRVHLVLLERLRLRSYDALLERPGQLRPILYHKRNNQNIATPTLLPSLLSISSFSNSRLHHRRHRHCLVDRRLFR